MSGAAVTMALKEFCLLACLVLCALPPSAGKYAVQRFSVPDSCSSRERRYVDVYNCLENTDSFLCWLLAKQLANADCAQRK